LAQQNHLLLEDRDQASNKLAAVQANMRQAQDNLSELVRLRAEVTKLRADSRELAQLKAKEGATQSDNTSTSPAKSPQELVSELRAKLAQAPAESIPELQFLTEQDWLNAVKGMQRLETDSDMRRALSTLRSSAKKGFAEMTRTALVNYVQANNGQSPTDLRQLTPYFATAPDAAVLQRYEIAQPGLVSEKSTLIDDQDDTYYQVTKDGVDVILGSVAEKTLNPAFEAYVAAHNGEKPKNPSQLQPYVKTTAEQAALQNLLQNPNLK
jgi:hypothetical protein